MLYLRYRQPDSDVVTLRPEDLPDSSDAACCMLAAKVDQNDIAGWKLGGTTQATRAAFQVQSIYYGPLLTSEVLVTPAIAPGFSLLQLQGEAEIALQLANGIENIVKGGEECVLRSPFMQLCNAWTVALEMPSTAIANLQELGITALLADRCAAGALILATPCSLPANVEKFWPAKTLELRANGHLLASGDTDKLLLTPEECLREFLLRAMRHGFEVRAGQWVSTGGITRCVTLQEGMNVVVSCDGEDMLSIHLAT